VHDVRRLTPSHASRLAQRNPGRGGAARLRARARRRSSTAVALLDRGGATRLRAREPAASRPEHGGDASGWLGAAARRRGCCRGHGGVGGYPRRRRPSHWGGGGSTPTAGSRQPVFTGGDNLPNFMLFGIFYFLMWTDTWALCPHQQTAAQHCHLSADIGTHLSDSC
jgi:hypothetical protein